MPCRGSSLRAARQTASSQSTPPPARTPSTRRGVNNNGVVAGFYVGTDGQDHGFMTNTANARNGLITGTAIADPRIPNVAGEPGATFVFCGSWELMTLGSRWAIMATRRPASTASFTTRTPGHTPSSTTPPRRSTMASKSLKLRASTTRTILPGSTPMPMKFFTAFSPVRSAQLAPRPARRVYRSLVASFFEALD
jgi:hypothetical protein